MALRVNHYLKNQPRASRSGVTSGTRPLGTAVEECRHHRYSHRSVEPAASADRPNGGRTTIPGTISFGAKLDAVPHPDADYFRGNVRARIQSRHGETVGAAATHRETAPVTAGGDLAGNTGIPAGNTTTRPTPVVTLPANNDHTATGRRAAQRSKQSGASPRRSGPMSQICPAAPIGAARPCLRVVVRTAAPTIGMPIAVECIQPSAARVRIGEPAHSPGRIHQPCWK
jgi:hypothetical protein